MDQSNIFLYRKAVYNLLYNLKRYMSANEYEQLIEELDSKFESVPNNTLEESKEFFFEVTSFMLKRLNEYYDISHEKNENDLFHSDIFILKPHGSTSEMIEKFNKYRNLSRFRDSFLQSYDSDFWRRFRSNRYRSDWSDRGVIDEDGNIVLTINKIPISAEQYLPRSFGNRPVGHGRNSYFDHTYSYIQRDIELLESMSEDYELLNRAITAFNERLAASLKEENIRFGISHLKEVLSRIIVPVSLIEDDKLRSLCQEMGREVFVKEPTMEDLLPIGASVNVFASHNNLEDDSSYVSKPILISETLPEDTEELKFLGVGQYTCHDKDSSRSLGGANPFVINNNIYTKALEEDFMEILPQELVEEIRICKNLLDSLDNPLESIEIEENETLTTIISSIKQDKSLDPKKIIDDFMLSSQYFIEEEEKETGPIYVEEDEYKFEPLDFAFSETLLTHNSTHPNGFVVFGDRSGTYAALKINESGEKASYISKDINSCFRALQLPSGLYSIYKFSDRTSKYKNQAILELYPYRKES
ncbi:hypothetical protein ABFV99_13895 [Cytobacillus horneckiae]|uniref:hypothetical protein n=1 Tax=Cytobacillus horneckiae TaxID=549687 RepID=UPI0034CE7263